FVTTGSSGVFSRWYISRPGPLGLRRSTPLSSGQPAGPAGAAREGWSVPILGSELGDVPARRPAGFRYRPPHGRVSPDARSPAGGRHVPPGLVSAPPRPVRRDRPPREAAGQRAVRGAGGGVAAVGAGRGRRPSRPAGGFGGAP